MRSRIVRFVIGVIRSGFAAQIPRKGAVALLLCFLVGTTGAFAQQVGGGSDSQQATIQMLLQRIDKLEARVAQLEAAQKVPASSAPLHPATQPSAEAEANTAPEPEMESEETHRMDPNRTLLNIRGFGDVTLHGDTHKGDTTSFTLGQLDLFVNSDVSDKFRFISEIVFEADRTNNFGVDVERYLLQYSHNDYFNVAVGRYHTAIGYYNTAYHHSTWLQTATGRPFLFAFEDGGGILPIHNVGVSVSGLLPSGGLGLHYVAELGNGRASRSPDAEPVQNVVDDKNGKAFNLALFARPNSIHGLQTGVSVYHDNRVPTGLPTIGETIVDAHAVYIRPDFEWLNEALVIRHSLQGFSKVYKTPGFYTQLSRRWGSYRPYFRYQWVNSSDSEPLFPQVQRQQGPSVGLRYDASESVALKVQYDYTTYRHQAAVNGLAAQLGFTF